MVFDKITLHFGMWLHTTYYPCPDKLNLGDIKMHLNTEMAQVVEILLYGRQGSIDSANVISYFDEPAVQGTRMLTAFVLTLSSQNIPFSAPDNKYGNGKKIYIPVHYTLYIIWHRLSTCYAVCFIVWSEIIFGSWSM